VDEIFEFFSRDLNAASNLAFYDSHIKFLPTKFVWLILALLSICKAKRG
jgi:hypothetical protein